MPRTPFVKLAESATQALVEQLADPPTTIASLAALANQVARGLGFIEASCWRISQHGRPSQPSFFFGREDPEWRERYISAGYLHADPVVQLIYRSNLPFTWGEAEKLKQDDLTQQLFKERRAKESQDAAVCPVFGPYGERVCVFFLSGGLLSLTQATRLHLSCIAHTLLMMAWNISGEYELPKDLNPALSRREAECVFWLSDGKSTGDTAAILGLSPHTVRGYLDSAMAKLDARNRDELVLRALPMGLLTSFR